VLVQTLLDLLAEPRIMVQLVFHMPLDVLLWAAVVLGTGSVHFRRQFGRQMPFHNSFD
jgi:hypothetical protein